MGTMSMAQRQDYMVQQAEKERQTNAILAAQRERIADKLVMVLTDSIVNDIVRPGPVAEERECYDMAQEVRDHRQTLKDLVLAVLHSERVVKLREE